MSHDLKRGFLQGKQEWPAFLAGVQGLLEELRSQSQLISRLTAQQQEQTGFELEGLDQHRCRWHAFSQSVGAQGDDK